jgi:hypothetical protein
MRSATSPATPVTATPGPPTSTPRPAPNSTTTQPPRRRPHPGPRLGQRHLALLAGPHRLQPGRPRRLAKDPQSRSTTGGGLTQGNSSGQTQPARSPSDLQRSRISWYCWRSASDQACHWPSTWSHHARARAMSGAAPLARRSATSLSFSMFARAIEGSAAVVMQSIALDVGAREQRRAGR